MGVYIPHELPPFSDLMDLAGMSVKRRAPMPNQVTFPIHREEQLDALDRLMRRAGIEARDSRFGRNGLEVSFFDADDAVLIKMSFAAA